MVFEKLFKFSGTLGRMGDVDAWVEKLAKTSLSCVFSKPQHAGWFLSGFPRPFYWFFLIFGALALWGKFGIFDRYVLFLRKGQMRSCSGR